MLSQCAQRAIHSEAQIDGQLPGVAVLRQVREGLEGLVEEGQRLAECGAVVGPPEGARSGARGPSVPTAAGFWSGLLPPGGRRSMRAAGPAWMVAGPGIPWGGCPSR